MGWNAFVRARRAAWLAGGSAVLVALAGCAAQQRAWSRARTVEAGMPCTEAARVARGALMRLGYVITTVTVPQPGAPGKVAGTRNTGWATATPEPGTEYTAEVTITCSNQGAEFDAATDEPLPGALGFRTEFPRAVRTVATRRVVPPKATSAPAAGVQIAVEPLRPGDVRAEFGDDLAGAGITPVRLTIENRTDRTYVFRSEAVQLVTQEGTRHRPVALAGVPAETRAVLTGKLIAAEAELAPRAVLRGFLYFPASAYRRATVLLVDRASDESEGFSVEF